MYFNRIVFNAIAVLHCLGLVFLRAVIRATLVVALLSRPTVFSLLLIVIYCGQINDDDDDDDNGCPGECDISCI